MAYIHGEKTGTQVFMWQRKKVIHLYVKICAQLFTENLAFIQRLADRVGSFQAPIPTDDGVFPRLWKCMSQLAKVISVFDIAFAVSYTLV